MIRRYVTFLTLAIRVLFQFRQGLPVCYLTMVIQLSTGQVIWQRLPPTQACLITSNWLLVPSRERQKPGI
ncbi:hypothetical protein J7438_22190 [Thalassotalea sp. G20_0]|uniref:hypothetical protein n=1 Tax=Thalassotalea sp. G20_0 TaxID=2821093 RepID=UPI001ADCAFAC|nr:hypothetical protein [Thalassotalea sp. G20_0]MBO9496774.1 hypothetical protein [Thalassotalea sp. G20_0]